MCEILEICVESDCKEQNRRLCYLCQKMRHHDSHQTIMETKFKEFLDDKKQKLADWDQIDLAQNFKQFKLNIQHKIEIINIWLDNLEIQFYQCLYKLEESWRYTKELLDCSFYNIDENNVRKLLNIDQSWGIEYIQSLKKQVIQTLKDLEQKIKIDQVDNPFENIKNIQKEQFVKILHNEVITKDRVFQIYFSGYAVLETRQKRWTYELDGQEIGGGEYVKGKRVGLWIIPILGENTRNNPFLKFQNCVYKDGFEQGICRITSIDQKIIEEGYYDKGLRVGPWKEVCESNQTVIFKGQYQGGLKNGEWNYIKGTNIIGGGSYKDGKKDGRWKEPDLLRYNLINFQKVLLYITLEIIEMMLKLENGSFGNKTKQQENIINEYYFILMEINGYLLLHNIAKPKNMGMIIRNAAAFNIKTVFIIGKQTQKRKFEIVEGFKFFGNQGTQQQMEFIIFPSLREAKEHFVKNGLFVCGVEIGETSENIVKHPFRGNTVFFMGNEGTGLIPEHRQICDHFVYIPQYTEKTASLNVSVASGIIFHHFALWAGYKQVDIIGEKFQKQQQEEQPIIKKQDIQE